MRNTKNASLDSIKALLQEWAGWHIDRRIVSERMEPETVEQWLIRQHRSRKHCR